MFRVTYKQQIKTKIILMMALSNYLASKHKFQEKTPHIFHDWTVRNKDINRKGICSFVKDFGNF